MFTVSNGLSLLRAPLALLFFIDNEILRVAVVVLAMLTDSIDGYLARRYRFTTQFGAILDPVMDKIFVFFALMALLTENRLELWQALAMISRDFFLCLFAIYLRIIRQWEAYQFKAIRWGKVTTVLQFLILIALSLNLKIPVLVYMLFILFGVLAFFELIELARKSPVKN
ncbi:MAG: CDP-alcohol phosphatidyltransferase family protein [Simkaniaceae bacterium]